MVGKAEDTRALKVVVCDFFMLRLVRAAVRGTDER